MNITECQLLCHALAKTGYPDMGGFIISQGHGFRDMDDPTTGYYEIVLTPLIRRIYFISQIFDSVRSLDIQVAIYTDYDKPGCIIIH